MGHDALEGFLKDISKEAGIDHTNRSNHSRRATSISRMYQKPHYEMLWASVYGRHDELSAYNSCIAKICL